MILQNPYMQAGNAIRLGGDLRRAASYKKYAWSKLNQLKTMMVMSGSNMIKKYYSVEGGCVDIIVQSVAGMDSIYINACSGGVKCSFSVSLTSQSSTTIVIDLADWKDDKNSGFVDYLIDWGDDEGIAITDHTPDDDSGLPVGHVYEEAGTYTITAKGLRRKGQLIVDRKGYFKATMPPHRQVYTAPIQLDGVDHANMLAEEWTLITSSTRDIPWDDVSAYNRSSNGGMSDYDGKHNQFRTGYYRTAYTPAGFFSSAVWFAGKSEHDISAYPTEYGKALIVARVNGDAGWSIGPPDPDHKCGVYADGVLLGVSTRETELQFTQSKAWEVPAGTSQVTMKDTNDYSYSDHGDTSLTAVKFWETNGQDMVIINPYDCLAVKSLTVTVT
jgi:hypothetical protein